LATYYITAETKVQKNMKLKLIRLKIQLFLLRGNGGGEYAAMVTVIVGGDF
jgi:hypothetical protein